MSWTTVALVAIGALVLIFLIRLVVGLFFSRAARRWFESESRRMDEEHEEWRRRHGFGPRR